MIHACPDCDSCRVYEREGYRHSARRMGSEPWRCGECGWTGREPDRRESRGRSSRSLAYRLRMADADEVSR